jgi:hypothetical protein
MRSRIVSFASVFGLLLAVAMVCATSAQSPEPQTPNTPSPVQNVPYVAPSETNPKMPATGYPPASATPPGGYRYPFISNTPYTPREIGRYQAVACNSQLLLIDTSSGECWTLNDGSWIKSAPPIAEVQKRDHERDAKPLDSERRAVHIWPAK